MKFKNDKLHGKIWHKFIGNRPDFLRRFAGDQNLISDFIKKIIKLEADKPTTINTTLIAIHNKSEGSISIRNVIGIQNIDGIIIPA